MSVYLFVCLFFCVIAKHPLPGVVKTSGQRTIKSERMLRHGVFDLLWILGELPREGL